MKNPTTRQPDNKENNDNKKNYDNKNNLTTPTTSPYFIFSLNTFLNFSTFGATTYWQYDWFLFRAK